MSYDVLLPTMFSVIAGMSFFFVALAVLEIVGAWFTYEKADIPGWKCIIPFYDSYVLADRVANDDIAAWLVVCQAVTTIGSVMMQADAPLVAELMTILTLVAGIGTIVLECIVYDKLSQGFGHGAGYVVGLLLLPVVFYPILGFSRTEKFDARRITPVEHTASSQAAEKKEPEDTPEK